MPLKEPIDRVVCNWKANSFFFFSSSFFSKYIFTNKFLNIFFKNNREWLLSEEYSRNILLLFHVGKSSNIFLFFCYYDGSMQEIIVLFAVFLVYYIFVCGCSNGSRRTAPLKIYPWTGIRVYLVVVSPCRHRDLPQFDR